MILFPKFRCILLILILSSFGVSQVKFNTIVTTDSIPINFNNEYFFSAVSIIPFSEVVTLKGKVLSKEQYTIFYDKAYLKLSDTLAYSIFDTLVITYQSYLTSLKKEYKRRTLVKKIDDITSDTIRVLRSDSKALTPESIFGKDMQKSGSIVRGFTVGTTRDFTLTSGLRLQLSGKISDDLEIVAALTDENTPIQPEGNTEQLDELDKVFIEVRHPNAIGTFGDYDFNNHSGEFGNISRRLQGLKGTAIYKDNSFNIAIAGSKGKFNTNQFTGIESVQGPYRLYGINNERDIIIIAGSEKVFIDGEEMKRGERNDYTIEYSNAEITFTPNRLITSASRITVDFEYTDRRYSRNFFGTNFQTSQLNKKLNIKLNFMREGDDQDSPIDINISDNDKNVLSSSGDNRNAAIKSGVSLAQPDSNGIVKGIYSKVDSLINGSPFTIYIYNPGVGEYNVSFSYVGENSGDYVRASLGQFRFVGIGQGSYMPVIFLPLPELKQMGNIVIESLPFDDVFLNLELAGSLWDKNRFSSIDDGDNFGSARNISAGLKPKEISISDINFGKLGFSYKDRFIQKKYTSLDRINEIEFSRNYNILNNDALDEQLREASLSYSPYEKLNLSSTYGYLNRGEIDKSNRFINSISFNDFNVAADYKLDYVNSKNTSISSNWNRQNGVAYYLIGKFKPGLNFQFEDKKESFRNSDSLLQSSLHFTEFTPFMEITDLAGLNFQSSFSFRDDSFPIDGVMKKESQSFTQSYDLNYRGIQEFNSSLNVAIRNKKFTEEFKTRGELNSETILIRSQSRANLFNKFFTGDAYYEVSSQKSARLERVFVRVNQGTGSYKYLGDLNNNGIAEENEFEPTLYDGDYVVTTIPTDELFPVMDLKANTRWRFEFNKIIDSKSIAGKLLNPISSETLLRVEENSKEEQTSKIYLLNLSSFLNDSTTIRGFNLYQQDLFLFENSSEFSLRFRFFQRRSLNQFSAGLEKGFNRERSIRLRFKMVQEVGNQTEYINTIDNVNAPVNSNRARMISSDLLSTDFSYRPKSNVEVGFKITVSKNQDDYPSTPTIIDQNSQQVRFNLSFAGTGRLRLELERNELNTNSTQNYLPFELTHGYYPGKNYLWRLSFDYRITGNLQSSINYDGRLQGAGKAIHTARAEARAYF